LREVTRKRLMVFSGTAFPELGEEVATGIGVTLGSVEVSRFSNGEIYVRYLESVRGVDAFVVQTCAEPVNDNLMELLIMIDALKRASAKRITAVIPYYGYSRQDKKTLAREPISAHLVADLITTAGADRVISDTGLLRFPAGPRHRAAPAGELRRSEEPQRPGGSVTRCGKSEGRQEAVRPSACAYGHNA
jgi:hypothetical protein